MQPSKSVPEIIIGALLAVAAWVVVAVLSNGLPANSKDYAGPAATVIAAAAAAWVAYKLGQAQLSIAKTQAETAKASLANAHQRVVLDLSTNDGRS
jgi:hypothetical protein